MDKRGFTKVRKGRSMFGLPLKIERVEFLPPTNVGVLPILFGAMQAGTWEGRRAAEQELTRMARLADRWVAWSREGA